MEYSSAFKRRLLSATFLIMSTALVAGCGFDAGHVMGDMFGDTRTLPDNDTVNFDNRHTPILNPSGNSPASGSMPDSMGDQGNAAPVSGHTPKNHDSSSAAASAPYAYNTSAASGRQVPVENQTLFAGNAPAPAVMSAPTQPVMASSMPAAPVTATPLPPSQASSPTEGAASIAEEAPIVLKKPAGAEEIPAPVASGDIELSGSKYPSLASVPPAPPAPAKDQSAAQLNGLVADQGKSEAERQQLMNNPGATVMTSPQTGQVVDNAATATAPTQPVESGSVFAPVASEPAQASASAAPVPAKSQGGFNGWLHGLFNKDQTPTAANTASASSPQNTMDSTPTAAPAAREVAPNVILGNAPPFPPAPSAAPDSFAQPVPQASLASVPPTAADISPVAAGTPLPQPVAAAPAPATPPFAVDASPPAQAGMPTVVPVTPQAAVDASMQQPTIPPVPSTSGLPDISQISGAPEAPVSLVPPSSAAGASPSQQYLPDSRYAARRAQDGSDSSTSGN